MQNKRVLLDSWCWRIAKEMCLTKPVKLHLIHHTKATCLFGEDLEDPSKRVYIEETTLGRFYASETIGLKPSKYHHIIVRLMPDSKQVLYLIAHELQHAKQWEAFKSNVSFLMTYRSHHFYATNPFEIECRRVGCEWVERIFRTGEIELKNTSSAEIVPRGTGLQRLQERELPFDQYIINNVEPTEYLKLDLNRWYVPPEEKPPQHTMPFRLTFKLNFKDAELYDRLREDANRLNFSEGYARKKIEDKKKLISDHLAKHIEEQVIGS